MSMRLDEHGAAEVLRAVNRLFNSPGHWPGGRCFFLILRFYYFLVLLSSYIDSTSVSAVILSGRVLTGMLLGGIASVCVCVYLCVCKEERILAIEDVRCSVLQYCVYTK